MILVFSSRRSPDSDWKPVEQRVPITWTACHFGGHRAWFRCPVYFKGRYCGRRVALLYGAGDLFACRHCYGFAYASRQETPTYRGVNRARKIRMRLGGSPDLLQPFSEKAARNAPGNVHAASGARPFCTIRSQVTLKWLSPLKLRHLPAAR